MSGRKEVTPLEQMRPDEMSARAGNVSGWQQGQQVCGRKPEDPSAPHFLNSPNSLPAPPNQSYAHKCYKE